MTWALLAIIAVCLVALVVIIRHEISAAAAVTASKTRATTAERRLADLQREADNAAIRLAAAEAHALDEHTRAESAGDRASVAEEQLAAAAPPTALAHLESLWSLALMEQDRVWRLTMALPQGGDNDRRTLTLFDALEGEISRIREETGTPGSLRFTLGRPPSAGESLIVLRAVQGLLAVLTRYSQAFDLRLDDNGGSGGSGGSLVATVLCEEFDGPDSVADEVTALLRALGPSRAEVDIDRSDDGRLRARLTIPPG